MPGLILEINVSNGEEVKEGQALLVLEAMKMENTITSPKDGVIKYIGVTKGLSVAKNELLIEFE
jgi:biotin carboxyl carrier protein